MRRDWQIMALLAAATIAVFWQVSRHEFVNFDDPAYVTYNPTVQQGLTWSGLAWAFGELHGEATYWHPVTWLSHMLDCQLFGLKPTGHHLSSLLLHTFNTLLLFGLLRIMTGWRGPSAMVAALFALHPLQVDSVAWVAERKNVLSTFFGLLCLWAYARYAKSRRQTSAADSQSGGGSRPKPQLPGARPLIRGPSWFCFSPSVIFYLLTLLFFALGLMSKPMLVTLPFVMLLLDYWPLGRLDFEGRHWPVKPAVTLVWEKVPLFALSALSSLITIRAHVALGALMSTEALPVPYRLANATVASALYLRKLFWPVDLSVFYLHPGRWPVETVAGSTLLGLTITALALWQWRRRPYLIVGWLWFLGTLVPVIGLVQAHVQAMADRFAYLPSIGVFIMVVWTVAEWAGARTRPAGSASLEAPLPRPARRQGGFQPGPEVVPRSALLTGAASKYIMTGLAGVVLAGCIATTWLQLRHWRDSITLMQRVVQVEPRNFVARVMLGNAFFERRRFDQALREYRTAQGLRPDYPDAWEHAGAVLIEQAKPAEAMPYLVKATQLAPGWPEAQRRLGLALARQGCVEEARAAYQNLARLMPATAEGRRDLADMLSEGQQFAEAAQYYEEALRLKPDFIPVLNNLALLRASCRQPEIRNGQEAVRLAEAACRLSQKRDPNFLGTLAAAYAEAGQFDAAIKTIQQAQNLAKATGANDLAALQAQMLVLFRAGKPYR